MKNFIFLLALLIAAPTFAQEKKVDLMNMNLDDLLDMKVSSISKKEDRLQDAASSIYVITEEDIRRSGATRLQEVLMMVPGVFFSDITYNYTAEGIREEAEEYSQTVLTLVDGVPITSPLTAGMSYYVFDMPLQEIERIEVIKGPGGTIYGANANTGIISIFTKSGKGVEGLQASVDGGLQNYVSPFVHYGTKISENTYLAGYAKFMTTRGYNKTEAFDGTTLNVEGTTITNKFPDNGTDGKVAVSGGLDFQTDLSDQVKSTFKFFYDHAANKVYTNRFDDPMTPQDESIPFITDEKGTEAIGSERIDWTFNPQHSLFLHTYYKYHGLQKGLGGGIAANASIFELEGQDNISVGINDISFGGNYRIVGFHVDDPKNDVLFTQLKTTKFLYAGFVQDKLSLSSLFDLTAGVKAETWTLVSNKPELSPSVRLTFKPDQKITLWSAASRSITTPGYVQDKMEYRMAEIPYITQEMAAALNIPYMGYDKLFLPGTTKCYVAIVSEDNVKPTEYYTYEFGARVSISPKVYIDLSTYYSRCNNGITPDLDYMSKGPTPSKVDDTTTILPIYYTNTFKETLYGGELIARITPIENLRTEISYSYLCETRQGLPIPGQPRQYYDETDKWTTPKHIIRFRPYYDIPEEGIHLTLNVTWLSQFDRGDKFNYLTQLPDTLGINANPPANKLKLDCSIEKELLKDQLSLLIWGRNILSDPYVEYFSQYVGVGYPHTIGRTFGMTITFKR